MKRATVAASIVALTALIGGCSGFGETLHRLARERSASATSTSAVSLNELVANARPGVVKCTANRKAA